MFTRVALQGQRALLGNLGRLAPRLIGSYIVLCVVLCCDARRANYGENSACVLG
jgi:hypothetical protein